MRSLRYLNSILTVIALLLVMHLWTLWTSMPAGMTPMGANAAQADEPTGIPNAGAQRQQMVDLLKKLVQQNDELSGLFKSGKARVRVDGGDKK